MSVPTEPDAELDALLQASARDLGETDRWDARAARVADEAYSIVASHRRQSMRRWWILAPVIILGAGGIAAAALSQLDLSLWTTNGVPVTNRVPISVEYRTASGQDVQCTLYLGFDGADQDILDQAMAWGKGHDWSQLGQTAYELVAARTFEAPPPPPPDIDDPNLRIPTIEDLKVGAFSGTLFEVIMPLIPADLTDQGLVTSAQDDCQGPV